MEKKSKDNSSDEPPPPQDNGPLYCSMCNWLSSMYKRFDGSFITFFIVQNFNHGLWIIATLAVKDYYKAYLGLDPGEMAGYLSIVHIPWSLKILYGLISDNVPICGTRRKSYLVIMGIVQFISLFSIYSFEYEDPLVVAIMLAFASLSEAFTNVVSDAIMVIQSRKDKNYGSQDFVTLMYLSTGFGGVTGCIFAGLMTEYYHPKWCFFYYSFFGIFVSITACRLTPEAESDKVVGDADSDVSSSLQSYEFLVRRQRIEGGQSVQQVRQAVPKREGFCFNLKKNLQAIGRSLLMKEIYFLVIFFLAKGVITPSFEDFSYFFLLNVIGISKFVFSLLVLIGQVCHIIGALIYKAWCRNVDTRWMIFFAMIVGIISSFLSFAFAKRWNLEWGIPDMAFLLFTDVVFSTIGVILYTLPILALFAKITPPKIEGTIFAFLTGTMNLANTIVAPNVGAFVNKQFVGVNKKDLSKYSTLTLISFIGSILILALLPLIPTRSQLREWKAVRDEENKGKLEERKLRREKKEEEENQLLMARDNN